MLFRVWMKLIRMMNLTCLMIVLSIKRINRNNTEVLVISTMKIQIMMRAVMKLLLVFQVG